MAGTKAVLDGIGIADLARFYQHNSKSERRLLWRLLGYEPGNVSMPADKKVPIERLQESDTEFEKKPQKSEAVAEILGFRPGYWAILKFHALHQSKTLSAPHSIGATGHVENTAQQDQTNRKFPLIHCRTDASWRHLASMAAQVPEPQIKQTVDLWRKALEKGVVPGSRGKTVARRESGEIWIILDFAYHLMLWWWELRAIGKLLHEQFGASRSRILTVQSDLLDEEALGWPTPDTRIFLFSDIGVLDDSGSTIDWRQRLRTWRQQGVGVTVYSPAPRQRLNCPDYEVAACHSWENHQTVNPQVTGKLLACLATVQWCSPRLLRAWRKVLQGGLADEYAVWRHPDVKFQPYACALTRNISSHRKVFRETIDHALKSLLMACIPEFRPYEVRDVLMEEALIRQSLGLAETAEASMWLQTLLSDHQQSSDEWTQRWLYRLSERQDAGFWSSFPALQQLCMVARKSLIPEDQPVPYAPGMIEETADPAHKPSVMSLVVKGAALQVMSEPQSSGLTQLLRLNSSLEGLRLQWETTDDGMQDKLVREGLQQSIPDDVRGVLTVLSDSGCFKIQKLEKPTWASAIEQTPQGLFCTLPDGRRLRWCYPGELNHNQGRSFDPLSSPEKLQQAAWVDVAQLAVCREEALPYFPKQTGSSEFVSGEDAFGRYADFMIQGIRQRFRWIPPGAFWMGSPKKEPERHDGEIRHKVTISQGYWLADTACSQALWRAVMGNNPSQFKGDDLPVEKVTWDDVQQFCQRLNQLIPGFEARLPTEAEWEYACRAGTETAFWWGNGLSMELANYDGGNPYHSGPKGEFRKKTLPVSAFRPNPWGLYQVHGNVYEWCEDWYGDYPGGEVVDPTGPEAGDWRVRRGGGWINLGGWLRAAFRDHDHPDVRGRYLGFRLARGPRPVAEPGERRGSGIAGENERQ